MRLRSAVWLCIMTAFVGRVPCRACASSPQPYFAPPRFIDPDYKPPSWSEVRYGRSTMFDLLVAQYATLDRTPPSAADDSARVRSSREESESYSHYLRGAELFKAQQYDSALTLFIDLQNTAGPHRSWLERLLGKSDSSWVREASCYMVARCQLIIAQGRYDGHWRPVENVDQELLRSAEHSYQHYLAQYPEGIYARSAQDIRRKICFLSGRQSELDSALRAEMLEAFPPTSTHRPPDTVYRGKVDEFKVYFRGDIDFKSDSPLLTAYAWLGKALPDSMDLAALQRRESEYTGYPGLFRYVRALGLYKLGRNAELLSLTPEDSAANTIMWLSTQLLRARAYARLGDLASARRAVGRMLDVSTEDAIVREYAVLALNHADGLSLFEDESPVDDLRCLRAVATFGLSDKELEAGLGITSASEPGRAILLEELARRYILSERYAQMSDLLVTNDLPQFKPARRTVEALVRDSRDVDALVELGEFLYENYITPGRPLTGYSSARWTSGALPELEPTCVPCAEFSTRSANYTSPLSLFAKAVAIARELNIQDEAEAKALHYIVLSERRGHWQDQCTWNAPLPNGIEAMSGKEAYRLLHDHHPNSPWTTATPYYYR